MTGASPVARLRESLARTAAWPRRRLPGLHAAPVPPLRITRCTRTGLLIAGDPPPPPPAPLNPGAIKLSLVGMTAGPQECAGDFYAYLFSARPHLRDMFPPQMTAQNERLFTALLKIVRLLDKPDALTAYLTQLGRDHRKYGVQPEHYPPVGEALIRALRLHCPAWTDNDEAAWVTAYTTASEVMIAGAAACTGPAAWTGRVVRHETRARDLAVLQVRTSEPLPYKAGQYVTVQARGAWRPFSIACAPGRDLIEFHVRAVPLGQVSVPLVRDTRPGDELVIGPPVGTMTPDGIDGRDLLLIAGGTGLAPLRAVAEEVLAADEAAIAAGTGARRNIDLLCGARTRRDLYDSPALHDLSQRHPWLQVIPVISDEPQFGGLRGTVADVALGYSDWTAGREAFIAGPPEMTRKAVRGLRLAGMDPARVHHDDLVTGDDDL